MNDPHAIMKILTDERDEYAAEAKLGSSSARRVYTYAEVCEKITTVLDNLIAEMARELDEETGRD